MSEIDEKLKIWQIRADRAKRIGKLKLLKTCRRFLIIFRNAKIDTTNVEPMSGGVSQENIFRKTEKAPGSLSADSEASGVKLTDAFPEKKMILKYRRYLNNMD